MLDNETQNGFVNVFFNVKIILQIKMISIKFVSAE